VESGGKGEARAHLLEELKLGIWTKEEYVEKIGELEGGGASASVKCQKVCHESPNWDLDNFYADE